MSPEKMQLVNEMGFSSLISIPPVKQLVDCFDVHQNMLKTPYGDISITTTKTGEAMGLNATGEYIPLKIKTAELTEEDKEILKPFENKTSAWLKTMLKEIKVDGEENRTKFKRAFILVIQKSFLLKGIETYKSSNKKSVDGCLYALMIIYFHESRFGKNPPESSTRQQPWIHYWTGKLIQERVAIESANATGLIAQAKMKVDKKKGKTQKKKRVIQDEHEIDSDY
ncbi:hypothetical protein PIB30_032161, partial [Stylosanthes scabra]|nr:hypothetical protein [Stylosanthes scabra]